MFMSMFARPLRLTCTVGDVRYYPLDRQNIIKLEISTMKRMCLPNERFSESSQLGGSRTAIFGTAILCPVVRSN